MLDMVKYSPFAHNRITSNPSRNPLTAELVLVTTEFDLNESPVFAAMLSEYGYAPAGVAWTDKFFAMLDPADTSSTENETDTENENDSTEAKPTESEESVTS